MNTWDNLADEKTLKTTAAALIANGIDVQVTENKETAKAKTLGLLPPESEVMTMTSATLDSAGITQEINRKDGNYMPVRDKLYAMDRNTQAQEMNRMGATPNIAIGASMLSPKMVIYSLRQIQAVNFPRTRMVRSKLYW